MSLRVLAISGSLREKSYNTALLREAVRLAPAGMAIEIASIREIPLYDADVEARGMPQAVTALSAKVKDADALLIATPEYNFSFPGVLKNVIDWLSRPPLDAVFVRKPLAIMGRRRPARFGARAVSSAAGVRVPQHAADAAAGSLYYWRLAAVRLGCPAEGCRCRQGRQRSSRGACRLDAAFAARPHGSDMIDLYYWTTSNGVRCAPS